MLILTTGVVLTALSSTIATAGKELMSIEIDLANPKMAKRFAVVSLALTIVVQAVMSTTVYLNSNDRITNLTSDEDEDVRLEYNLLIYIFLCMMFLETINSHFAAMLLSLGLYKRELIIRTLILLLI
jgi:Na+-driven multidrug efflux pump